MRAVCGLGAIPVDARTNRSKAGGIRGIGLELQTNQLFVVERNSVRYFQLLPLPVQREELYATVLLQTLGPVGENARLSFTFDQANFRFDLPAHCRERVPEVATHLRLQRQYALPDVLCRLCGEHVVVNDETGVVEHRCPHALPTALPAGTAPPAKDAGCVMQ